MLSAYVAYLYVNTVNNSCEEHDLSVGIIPEYDFSGAGAATFPDEAFLVIGNQRNESLTLS